jgi:hypothetical protein
VSEQGKYSIWMQADGHLVMYRADGTVRWSAKASGWYSIMQGDGNFVLYNSAYQPTFSTGTGGHPNALLHVQDDGNLVIYGSDWHPLWWIGADPPPDDPQTGGDLVGRDFASTGGAPAGHIGIYDGNVIYDVVDNGPNDAVEQVTLGNYKKISHYWGAARPRVPLGLQLPEAVANCFSDQCPSSAADPNGYTARRAIVLRAYQIAAIRARYTFIAPNTIRAAPGWYGGLPRQGVYRCDTFVIDAYTYSEWIGFNWTADQTRWDDLVDSLGSTFEVTPGTVFAKVKGFR